MNSPTHAVSVMRTLRLKVKPEAVAWLNAAASEVNAVWNRANEVSVRAARPFAGKPKWLSGFELNNLSAGATRYFERIGADTIQRVNGEYAAKCRAASGWGMLRQMLRYKGEHAGRSVIVACEQYTSRACSSCGSLTGPQGVNGLRVRRCRCANCGESHDRDVNAARNLLRRAEVSASVRGNESPPVAVPPRRASRSRRAGIQAPRAAA
jgi:putative transposase-like DNA-binding protein